MDGVSTNGFANHRSGNMNGSEVGCTTNWESIGGGVDDDHPDTVNGTDSHAKMLSGSKRKPCENSCVLLAHEGRVSTPYPLIHCFNFSLIDSLRCPSLRVFFFFAYQILFKLPPLLFG